MLQGKVLHIFDCVFRLNTLDYAYSTEMNYVQSISVSLHIFVSVEYNITQVIHTYKHGFVSR